MSCQVFGPPAPTPPSMRVVSYEGYGPGGLAVIVEATTDNRNRTAADIAPFLR